MDDLSQAITRMQGMSAFGGNADTIIFEKGPDTGPGSLNWKDLTFQGVGNLLKMVNNR